MCAQHTNTTAVALDFSGRVINDAIGTASSGSGGCLINTGSIYSGSQGMTSSAGAGSLKNSRSIDPLGSGNTAEPGVISRTNSGRIESGQIGVSVAFNDDPAGGYLVLIQNAGAIISKVTCN